MIKVASSDIKSLASGPLGGILTEGPYEVDGRMTGECRRFGEYGTVRY